MKLLFGHHGEPCDLTEAKDKCKSTDHIESGRNRSRKLVLGLLGIAIVVLAGVSLTPRANLEGTLFDSSEETRSLVPDFSLRALIMI